MFARQPNSEQALTACLAGRARRPCGKESKASEAPVRSSIAVRNKRRVLCIFPRYTQSFGTFNHAYRLMRGVRAFMPPQGLLLIAAYMPAAWQVRFVDENIRPASAAELAWADAVMISAMHIQAPQVRDIHARAKAARKG